MKNHFKISVKDLFLESTDDIIMVRVHGELSIGENGKTRKFNIWYKFKNKLENINIHLEDKYINPYVRSFIYDYMKTDFKQIVRGELTNLLYKHPETRFRAKAILSTF